MMFGGFIHCLIVVILIFFSLDTFMINGINYDISLSGMVAFSICIWVSNILVI
jgi:hypothetical protein